MAFSTSCEKEPSLSLPNALPRCRTCKKTLSNLTDRQKTRDKWWTSCLNCRNKHAAKSRQRRDAGLLSSRKSTSLGKRGFSETDLPPDPLIDHDPKNPRFSRFTDISRATKGLSRPDRYDHAEEWWRQNKGHATCAECGEWPIEAWMTSCGHLLCDDCYEAVLGDAIENGLNYATCKACDAQFHSSVPLTDQSRRQKQPKRQHSARKDSDARLSTECSICADKSLEEDLPTLSGCTHKPDVCKECFSRWLETQLENTAWNKMLCPTEGCHQLISHSDVKKYAPEELFARFDELSMRTVLSADPNFRYCLAEGCSSGQIHDTEFEGNIFRCNACGFRVCTVHDLPFHTGETCAQYDKRREQEEQLKRQRDRQREKQNEKSVAEIEASTTKCPGCEVPIHKYEACDHITCTQCKFEFCYICRAPYRGVNGIFRAGNTMHTPQCRYHPHHLPDYQEPAANDRPVLPESEDEAEADSDPEIAYVDTLEDTAVESELDGDERGSEREVHSHLGEEEFENDFDRPWMRF